jgi:hypothetical protein
VNLAFAQSAFDASGKARVDIIHDPLLATELPAPGTPFQLKVKLTNTRDTDRHLSARISLDGRMHEVAPSKVFLDEYDQPTYEIDLFAPLADISYQFLLHNPDKSTALSDRYHMRRSCIPRVDTSGLDIEKARGEEKLATLIKTAEGLAREISSHETAQKLLDELILTLEGK